MSLINPLRNVCKLVAIVFVALSSFSAVHAEEELTVEEILTGDPSQADYGENPRCLRTQRIKHVEVLDDKHVTFKLSRKEYYLVRFKHRCPGLRRGQPIMYEPSDGSRLCKLDAIRVLHTDGLGGFNPGVRCNIPQFEQVTKEQIVLLKDTLKAQKRKKKKPDA